MSTRAQLEAALQKAEVDWRAASHDLDMAQAELTRAGANWDQLVTDRARAKARLVTASAERDKAIAALDAHNRAQRKT